MLGNNANNNAKYLGAYENILPLVHIVNFKQFLINAMHEKSHEYYYVTNIYVVLPLC